MPIKRKTVIKIIIGIAAFILIKNFLYYTEVGYSYPIWSKDGKRIYYIKNIDYYRFAQGGFFFEYRIYKTKSYVMSMKPNCSGKRIIVKFSRQNLPRTSIHNLAILPNNKELTFCVWAPGVKYIGPTNENGLYRINTNGTNLIKLMSFGDITQAPKLFVSPDGTKIAYTKERYGDGFKNRDIIGSVFSSWLMDSDGRNNHMICGEESEVKGWTTNGYLIISAYADLEGNAKLEYDNKANHIVYPNDVTYRTLIYDPATKKFAKNILDYFSSKRTQEEIKNLGFIKYNDSISPDGKKKIFWKGENLGVMDIDGKNKKILLKGKTH
ncbi:MAG: hypothetical protein ABH847_02010 [Candidatus Omnitrophota bacterium]